MADRSGPDIVLICLDSVRKDFFEETATGIARRSDLSFDQCRAASSWSTPSHASMISGLLPHEHGVHTHSPSFGNLPADETLFREFEDYRTVGISANAYAGPAYDFDRYFDRFVELERRVRFPEGADPTRFGSGYENPNRARIDYVKHCLTHRHPIKSSFNGVFNMVDKATGGKLLPRLVDEGAKHGLRLAREEIEEGDGSTFVFLNLMEGHVPYRPGLHLDGDLYETPWDWSTLNKGTWELCGEEYDERYWTRRNQLYRAQIDYLDRRISAFIDSLDDDVPVVVTADHGDNLGTEVDGGLANHKSSLSEGLLHVPLTVCNSSTDYAGDGSAYVSHLQLPDLLSGLRDGRIEDLGRDRIYAELIGMSGGSEPDSDYEYWDRMIRCGYRDSEKVVWDSRGNGHRYRLDGERPNWQREVERVSPPPEWATSRFEADIETYKRRARSSGETVDVDEATEERLQELGYL